MRRLCTTALVLLTFSCGDDGSSSPDAGPTDSGTRADECPTEEPCVLSPGVRSEGYIAEVGDQDPWTFEVGSAGAVIDLVVLTDAMFSPIQLEVALFGPGGEAIVNRRSPGAVRRQRVEIQVFAGQAGTYRAVISDVGSDDADRRNPYFLEVALVTDIDESEPNDGAEEATQIAFGATERGTIAVQGDQDWYVFDLPANRLLQVQAASPGSETVRHRWSLYASDATTKLAESTEPTGTDAWPVDVRELGGAGGRFYLVVEDQAGTKADQSVYAITIDSLERVDGRERNETPESASVVEANTQIEGFIGSTADVDWYAIDVPSASPASPRILTAEAAFREPSPVELQMEVYLPDGTTPVCEARDGDLCRYRRFVRDGEGEAGPTRLVTAHLVTVPGLYLVSVRDLQDDEFDRDTAYRFTASLPTEPEAAEAYGEDNRMAAVDILPVTSTTGTRIEFDWAEGYISYVGDTDWFRYVIPGPEDANPGQNGDWLVEVQVQMLRATPVELNAFFFGVEGVDPARYDGLGRRCRPGAQDDRDPCQWPDEDNTVNIDFRTTLMSMEGDCFVVFREVTGAGPHYWRMSDLDRDDFDLGQRYRLKMTVTAGCPGDSACADRFLERGTGRDLCGRP